MLPLQRDTASPAAFFKRHIAAFQNGEYAECAEDIAVPTLIYVGERRIFAGEREALVEILRTFHQNLMVEDYAKTDVQFFDHDIGKDGACRTLLQWKNMNSRGGEINQMDVSYFCRRSGAGSWRIELIEIQCNGSRYLTDGLPIH